MLQSTSINAKYLKLLRILMDIRHPLRNLDQHMIPWSADY